MVVITSVKGIENSRFNGQWQCIHVAWLYTSMLCVSCKVVVDWVLHFVSCVVVTTYNSHVACPKSQNIIKYNIYIYRCILHPYKGPSCN
jgi:hypothetical protein